MLELVEITSKHKPGLIRILNKDSVARWLTTPPFPYLEKDADEFIEKCEKKNNTEHRFAIEKSGIHIGGIGLHVLPDNKGFIGYYLDDDYWGKGYGTEAVKKILELAFIKLNLKLIYAYTIEGNIASESLLLKSGFTEKLNPKIFTKNGKSFNSKYFFKENK